MRWIPLLALLVSCTQNPTTPEHEHETPTNPLSGNVYVFENERELNVRDGEGGVLRTTAITLEVWSFSSDAPNLYAAGEYLFLEYQISLHPLFNIPREAEILTRHSGQYDLVYRAPGLPWNFSFLRLSGFTFSPSEGIVDLPIRQVHEWALYSWGSYIQINGEDFIQMDSLPLVAQLAHDLRNEH